MCVRVFGFGFNDFLINFCEIYFIYLFIYLFLASRPTNVSPFAVVLALLMRLSWMHTPLSPPPKMPAGRLDCLVAEFMLRSAIILLCSTVCSVLTHSSRFDHFVWCKRLMASRSPPPTPIVTICLEQNLNLPQLGILCSLQNTALLVMFLSVCFARNCPELYDKQTMNIRYNAMFTVHKVLKGSLPRDSSGQTLFNFVAIELLYVEIFLYLCVKWNRQLY